MTPAWKWTLGILIGLVIITGLGFPWMMQMLVPGGYGMMGYGRHMPMMYGAYPMLVFGGLLSALIQLGLLVLIILGIVWLWGAISKQNRQGK